jgi:hypothetical protein
LEKASDVINFFYHVAVLELVLNKICVIWTSHFKKFLEIVLRPLRLALEIVFGYPAGSGLATCSRCTWPCYREHCWRS